MFTTLKQIEKLRPTFRYGEMEMVEWFEVETSKGWCHIRSGLRHADGETKSPYYYDHCEFGLHNKTNSIKLFNEFWDRVDPMTDIEEYIKHLNKYGS